METKVETVYESFYLSIFLSLCQLFRMSYLDLVI